MNLKSYYKSFLQLLGFRDSKETPNVQVTLDVYHYRDGKLIAHIKPYAMASLFEKIVFHISCGKIINLTRSA